jgi:hypothetical protein
MTYDRRMQQDRLGLWGIYLRQMPLALEKGEAPYSLDI